MYNVHQLSSMTPIVCMMLKIDRPGQYRIFNVECSIFNTLLNISKTPMMVGMGWLNFNCQFENFKIIQFQCRVYTGGCFVSTGLQGELAV